MSKKDTLERFTETQSKKVILTEAVLVALAARAYQKRIWEDGGLIRKSGPAFLGELKQRTTGWVQFRPGDRVPLADKLEELKARGDSDEYAALSSLAERLRVAGGVMARAVAQIRPFSMGESPWDDSPGKSIFGTLRLVGTENPDGTVTEVQQEVELESGLNLTDEADAARLSDVIKQLPDSEPRRE